MIDLNKIKEKIISAIHSEGPLLPIQISRKLERDTIFAGAVLSELVKEKALLMTNAKIGGSPLYYLSSQEGKLSILYTYLPSKEKEVYEMLRKNQVLKDIDCDPATRVALRSIKDFSFPLEIDGEIYWRWYLTTEDEAKKLIETINIKIKPQIIEKEQRLNEKKDPVQLSEKDAIDTFLSAVNTYFKNKGIPIFDVKIVKKMREIEGKIKINSDLGILEYFFLAKNKKRINEADLSLANDSGKKNRSPVLFLSNGEMTKKSEKYLNENLKGRIIFRKI